MTKNTASVEIEGKEVQWYQCKLKKICVTAPKIEKINKNFKMDFNKFVLSS